MENDLQVIREISGTFGLMVEMEIIKTERDAHLGRLLALINADGSGYSYNIQDAKDMYIKKLNIILNRYKIIQKKANVLIGENLITKVLIILDLNKGVMTGSEILYVLVAYGNLDLTHKKLWSRWRDL